RWGQQVLADRQLDLAVDEQVVLEDQQVHHQANGALDGVLESHEAVVDGAVGRGPQNVGERRQGDELGLGQVGLAEEGLLGEGPGRAQESDTGHQRRILTTSMDEPTLRQLLADVRAGVLSADDAVARLRRLPFADLGFARVDHHRALRQGLAEAVYAPGKTPEQCAVLVAELLAEEGAGPVLLTRADGAQVEAAVSHNPGGTRAGTTVVWRPRY